MDESVRILLVEDDEDDFIMVRTLLAKVTFRNHILDWVNNYKSALEVMRENRHDAYLLDYRLDSRDGLQLLREAVTQGCRGPIIFLTGVEDYSVDMGAMKAGAIDYLVKGQINAPLLERSIRYAIERKRAEEALATRERELREKSANLEEMNTALKALFRRRKEDKREMGKEVLTNIKNLVSNYIGKLKQTRLSARQKEYVNLIEENLYRVTSPFLRKLDAKFANLTPREVEIALLIKEGRSTKEIAEILGISTRVAQFHRGNLRKKFGLSQNKPGLRTYLATLE